MGEGQKEKERASIPRRAKRSKNICHRKDNMFTAWTYGCFKLFKYAETHRKLPEYRDTQAQAHTCMYVHTHTHTNRKTKTNQPKTSKAPNIACSCWMVIFMFQEHIAQYRNNISTRTSILVRSQGSVQTSSFLIVCVCIHVCTGLSNLCMYRLVQLIHISGLSFMQIRFLADWQWT